MGYLQPKKETLENKKTTTTTTTTTTQQLPPRYPTPSLLPPRAPSISSTPPIAAFVARTRISDRLETMRHTTNNNTMSTRNQQALNIFTERKLQNNFTNNIVNNKNNINNKNNKNNKNNPLRHSIATVTS